MYCSDKVLNPYRVGLDLTAQRNLGESDSHPSIPQPNARPRIEPSNLDFSKSMAQEWENSSWVAIYPELTKLGRTLLVLNLVLVPTDW